MAPQQISTYHYGAGALLSDVSVTAPDGTPVSKTTYSYFDSGKLAASHWVADGLQPRTLDESYDQDGHVVRQAAKEAGAGSEVSNTFAAGQLFASDIHHEDGTTQNTQSTRNYYDDSLRLIVSVSLVADAFGDGTPVTGFAGTRYVRSDDGRIAKVEMDKDGDCTADGFITYTRASADGAVVEQMLGSAVSPEAARRTFSAECAVDLSNPPARPYAI
jgi:hypothetical protein